MRNFKKLAQQMMAGQPAAQPVAQPAAQPAAPVGGAPVPTEGAAIPPGGAPVPPEGDPYGDNMAQQSLAMLNVQAAELSQLIPRGTRLEDWIEFKINRAADDLNTVLSYMKFGQVKTGGVVDILGFLKKR